VFGGFPQVQSIRVACFNHRVPHTVDFGTALTRFFRLVNGLLSMPAHLKAIEVFGTQRSTDSDGSGLFLCHIWPVAFVPMNRLKRPKNLLSRQRIVCLE
jgi:hypothetical protein